MSVLTGTQLDLMACVSASSVSQEPIEDYVWFVAHDDDITPELYKHCEKLFDNNLLVLDLETYGAEMPEGIQYKKKANNYKKSTVEGLQELALSPIYGDIRLFQVAALNS